jgi:hypothetical protein
MFEGVDPGFCGPSYQATDVLQDAQDAINYYLEQSPQPTSKKPIALLGAPGLNPVLSPLTGQARGCWVLPGGSQALYVVGSAVFLVTISVPATSTSIPQFSSTQVGTLQTNTGPVAIRDNGVLTNGLGGYAVIVDGANAYYYLLSGSTYRNSFTGGVMSGTNVVTLPGSLPNGLIISSAAVISDAAGYIPAGTLINSIDTIGLTISMSNVASGTNASEAITLTIPPFGQITDGGFLGADRVAFIEGYLVFNEPGTRTFYTTGPTPYQMLFPGAFYALKDSSTDNIVTMEENNRELWLIGERTSEVWYGSGLSSNFYFSRIPGVGPQIGCSAVASISRLGNVLIWLGKNEQGENIVVTTAQYSWARVSNHAVEHAISSYPVVSDAVGYCYEEEGHLFYMLTFPTADVTWCYDATTKQWHKRLSWNSSSGTYHRHRGNCFMDFGDVRLVGDYQTGQLHQMSRQFYTDAGNPLRALRRTPHIWQKDNRERVFFSQLQIEFTPGVGLQSGQGSNPQVMLKWSDDGGFTFGGEQWTSIGSAGETYNRAIWYMLGHSRGRDRVWEFVISDPVPRDVIGATCYLEQSR